MEVTVESKTCTKCGETKEAREFNRSGYTKDGLSRRCRICTRVYDKAQREKPDRIVDHAARARQKRRTILRQRDRGNARRRGYEFADEGTLDFMELLLNDLCSYCGGPGGTLDHIVPVSAGGANHSSNLTASCRRCNDSKFIRSLLQWLVMRAHKEAGTDPNTGRKTST
jgi:5-methylcytosine-specific restriction endonuclease McrA